MPRPKGAKTRRPNPKKTGARFTLTEREGLKAQVARLDLQGYTQLRIAEQLDVSQSTACVLLKEVREDYQAAYVDNRKALVMKATAAHLNIIREAQEQIERLKAKGKRRSVTRSGANPGGGYRETVETTEDADIAGLLSVVTENWTRIARLHGLEELPNQVFNVQVNNNSVNLFDRLLQAVLGTPGAADSPEGRVHLTGEVIDTA